MPSPSLLASSATLDGIQRMVIAFYCGEPKTLQPVSADEWEVLKASGQPCPGVRIVHKRGRFRFEMMAMGYTPARKPQRATDTEIQDRLRDEVANTGDC